MLRRSVLRASSGSGSVVVCGGGIVGAATARGLQILDAKLKAENLPGFDSISLVDGGKQATFSAEKAMNCIRTVAVTPQSAAILNNLGMWESAKLSHAHPYYRMAIRHEAANPKGTISSGFAGIFGARHAPLLEFTDLDKPLGYICYNDEILANLTKEIIDAPSKQTDAEKKVDITFGASMDKIVVPARGSAGPIRGQYGADNKSIEASLFVGCDGRGSALRNAMTTPTIGHDYAQHGFVCTVKVEEVDDGNICAFQNFFSDGSILAYLPTSDTTANLIFSTSSSRIPFLTKEATEEQLVSEFNARLYEFAPNDIPKITGLAKDAESKKPVGAFPLKLTVATNPVASRAILIGDAAHGVHPMAGQGLNMGLYDVAGLVDELRTAIEIGEDVGSEVVLQRVANRMLRNTAPVIGAMEAIKTAVVAAPSVSCIGMRLLDNIGMGKGLIQSAASGSHLIPEKPGSSLLFGEPM